MRRRVVLGALAAVLLLPLEFTPGAAQTAPLRRMPKRSASERRDKLGFACISERLLPDEQEVRPSLCDVVLDRPIKRRRALAPITAATTDRLRHAPWRQSARRPAPASNFAAPKGPIAFRLGGVKHYQGWVASKSIFEWRRAMEHKTLSDLGHVADLPPGA